MIRMDGLGEFADEVKNCVEIPLGRQKLKVLSLERILASKIAANRAKDRLTIPVLRDAVAATQTIPRWNSYWANRGELLGRDEVNASSIINRP